VELASQTYRAARARAFSLVELVIVVIIIGIIAAIALPRMSSSAELAAQNALVYDQNVLQRAIDLYREEHAGTLPHVGASGNKEFLLRLLGRTTDDGTVGASGYLGPYIHAIPTNKANGLATVRIGGVAAGANTHGWRYATATGLIEPDHTGKGYVVLNNAKVQGEVTLDEVLDAIKKSP